jgi:hypothetical protein
MATTKPYSRAAKKAGEPVDLRIAAGNWVSVTKPRCRRGKHYAAHVRAVAEQFEQLGVPKTSANFRRMGFGRVARLKAALAEITAEDAVVAVPDKTE